MDSLESKKALNFDLNDSLLRKYYPSKNYKKGWSDIKKYFINKLYIKNFKCFDNSKFYEFAFKQDANLIILSGPNGFGKTTFFDAIE